MEELSNLTLTYDLGYNDDYTVYMLCKIENGTVIILESEVAYSEHRRDILIKRIDKLKKQVSKSVEQK